MLQKIAEIVSLPFVDGPSMDILKRIRVKIAASVTEADPAFIAIVTKAEEAVNREGELAIAQFIKQITAPPLEKVLKIKSSPKGARLKIAAPNGVRFSFGPIWNASVTKGKGPAVYKMNREKLNHQAVLAGINNPQKMAARDLCAVISKTFS